MKLSWVRDFQEAAALEVPFEEAETAYEGYNRAAAILRATHLPPGPAAPVAVVPHPDLTESRVAVLTAELQALLARRVVTRMQGGAPGEVGRVVLAAGKVEAVAAWTGQAEPLWVLRRIEGAEGENAEQGRLPMGEEG